jgi:hypothetical protein
MNRIPWLTCGTLIVFLIFQIAIVRSPATIIPDLSVNKLADASSKSGNNSGLLHVSSPIKINGSEISPFFSSSPSSNSTTNDIFGIKKFILQRVAEGNGLSI